MRVHAFFVYAIIQLVVDACLIDSFHAGIFLHQLRLHLRIYC